ncbi:DUF1735 domain-containing protein [Saccharicrinis fermentans]|uniref:BT-3987-like N-terminal domain-containing protein n=1 Tax=Saccharicrinis fermentans DSM 9555 = JCM 21142 TaxID=869213 RepID=W7Y5D3_9BACT|nr:DUF1735 domain-containing protein [Saccharicrinis fermentans]GAF02778.1 hypothetical protein JCM21142_41420 [Saccharicrinis fermentans DSM 9555 = JCM 21142]
MKKLILLSLFLAAIMTGCYDEYKTDFDYTAAYFSYQTPVRTVIIDPEVDNFVIKVGAMYGGRYDYGGQSESVVFSIEDTLITNNTVYTDKGIKVMPESWYTLSDDSEIKISNDNAGFVDVSIIKDSLVKYPEAANNTYAIPFLLKEATTDSILENKNYSIVVVKYKNEFDGRYYIKGKDDELAPDGSVVSSVVYNNPSLVLNNYMFLNTVEQDVVKSRVGSKRLFSDYDYNMKIRSSDGKAILSLAESSKMTDFVGNAKYDFGEKMFVCNYTYTMNAVKHSVVDTLVYANTEIELEDWLNP